MNIQNSDCMTGGPWYNTYICKKLHEKLFDRFIINSIIVRYHIMGSINAYEKEHQTCSCDGGIRDGGCQLPKN